MLASYLMRGKKPKKKGEGMNAKQLVETIKAIKALETELNPKKEDKPKFSFGDVFMVVFPCMLFATIILTWAILHQATELARILHP